MVETINTVTIPAQDVAALRRFYESVLGWVAEHGATPGAARYHLRMAIFAVEQAPESPSTQASRPTWVVHVPTHEAVDSLLASAEAAGARNLKSPDERDYADTQYWGRFADPEGNLWEVHWDENLPINGAPRYAFQQG
jgi:uncharacterized glyoxalase superfamily protein PhnB